MRSQFKHSHAVAYFEAWTRLSNMIAFKPREERLAIINQANKSVIEQVRCRMTDNCERYEDHLTDTERAQLAAIDEHLFADKPDNVYKRDEYVVEIGEKEEPRQMTSDEVLSIFSLNGVKFVAKSSGMMTTATVDLGTLCSILNQARQYTPKA
jgi:hypothetical protein